MSKTLRTPSLRRGAIAIATSALLVSSAAAATHAVAADDVAGPETRGLIGKLPLDPDLGVHPNLDSTPSWLVAVTTPKAAGGDGKTTANSGQLWFSRLDDRPAKLDLAPVPSWAHPHFGTDAKGRDVAIYPRCAGGSVGDCDLYAWDVEANTERKLTEVDADGVGELEGTMQRGAVVWTVADTSVSPTSAADYPAGPTTLRYRTTDGNASTLSAQGGTDLTLDRGRVAQVLFDESTYRSRVQLLRAGKPKKTLVTYDQAAAPRWATGLRFFGQELRFGMASQDHTALYRVPLSRPKSARVVQLPRTTFTTLAFARRDLLVWASGDTGSSTSKPGANLYYDYIPKSFR